MELEYLHDKLYEILEMFDKICKEEGITYFMDSGTAIGVVRENDFIPWDDDIDIAIKRSDYIKFRRIIKNRLPKGYKFIEPIDYEPYFYDFVPHIIDEDVPLRLETEEDVAYKNYQNRAAIDFIILDDAPDSKMLQKIMKFKIKMFYGMAMSKRFKVYSEKYSLKEKVLSGICRFLGAFFEFKDINRMYMKNSMKYYGKKSRYFIRSNSVLSDCNCYLKKYYRGIKELPFHGGVAPLPVGYDEILRQQYGDYMTPVRDENHYKKHID